MDISLENTPQSLKSIPGPKGNFLTGNLSEIDFELLHQYVKKHAFEYGAIYRLTFAHKPVIVLSDPETIRTILKNRPEKFRRISNMQTVFSEIGANGVFSSEGDEWRTQRKIMNQAFKTSQIKNYLPIIDQSTERLKTVMNEIAQNGESIDIQALFQRYTVDITSNLAFGYDMNSLYNDDSTLQEKINVIFPMIGNRIKAPFPYWRYFKLKKDRQFEEAIDFFKQQSQLFIKAAEENINSGKKPDNILESMITARDETENSFTEQQLFPNILAILLAGEDTTANTLGWVIHYLAENPEYQTKIHNEIDSNLNQLDSEKVSELNDFPLLSAALQEAMRLMPVAPFLYLENNSPENIHNYHIPAGTMIIVLLSQSGHLEQEFSEPEKFIPERWLNLTTEKKKKYAKDLMHFGSGTRQCPGMQLSLMEMKSALVMLLKYFTFSNENNSKKVQDTFAFTVMPKNLMINIKQR